MQFGRIAEQAYAEEDAFHATLRQVTTVLDTAVAKVRESGGRSLPGSQAFLLHDTYRPHPGDGGRTGRGGGREGLTALMNERRERARADARARKVRRHSRHCGAARRCWIPMSRPARAHGTSWRASPGCSAACSGRLSGASVESRGLDVQCPVPGLVMHQVRITAGELDVDDTVQTAVDSEWRLGARQVHSGAHVLHAGHVPHG